MSDMAYHIGVFMGDGFVENYKPGSSVCYVGLKSIDKDFVEHYQCVLERITGRRYKLHIEDDKNPRHNIRYRCRVGHRELVEKTLADTERKTRVPDWIMSGTNDEKKAFIQGVMDSEAWIQASLNPIGPSIIQLSVGVSDRWCFDLHRLFSDVGIETTKVGKRVFGENPKYLKPRKDFFSFSINVLMYIEAGLSFNLLRKRDRLHYCSIILRDFTRDYPKYDNYFGIDDKVRPLGKPSGICARNMAIAYRTAASSTTSASNP